ncbi:hypothetical protein P9314_04550 [Paenibacillus validus]|uniref:Uncharacterized protein n=1 Tax=Paenibacillus validus TaxID=44253 RepID=A0A7X2ZB08_9BACL|nr:hypothetical protein [Paenibacillus validus]MED4599979.1 hypothetical protein [Paenibacillus validus]MED4605849.1 hypothetical protein [Paenibacillus validus]MUG70928.1 hypothetical protein [Paenibacillus validus]
MISNREIKEQIDGLTEQNQLLTQELQQIKDLIRNQSNNNKNNQNNGTNQSSNENNGNHQSSSSQSDKQSSGNQQSSGNGNQDAATNSGQQINDIAVDFLKLKDLTDALEMKMQEYIATNQKKSALTNEDVISLILNMMNGMIDWTRDLIAQQSSQSQLQ